MNKSEIPEHRDVDEEGGGGGGGGGLQKNE